MMWREINNFSSGSVCMVLASDYFDESDYFRRHEDFLQAVRDRELLQVASLCHEEAAGRGKWLRTRIKESAPQVLATG